MSDVFQTPCPQCGHTLRVRREYVGKNAACKHCQAVFTIPAPAAEPAGGPELAALHAEVARLTAEAQGLREASVRLERAAELDRQSKLDVARERDQARTRADEWENRGQLAESEAAKLRAAEVGWNSDRTHAEAELASLRSALQDAHGAHDETRARLDQLHRESARVADELVQALRERDALRSNLATEREQARAAREAEREVLDRQANQLTEEATAARAEAAQLGESVESAAARARALQDERDQARAEAREVRDQLAALDARLAEMESSLPSDDELARLRAACSDLEARLEEERHQAAEARALSHLAREQLRGMGIRLPG